MRSLQCGRNSIRRAGLVFPKLAEAALELSPRPDSILLPGGAQRVHLFPHQLRCDTGLADIIGRTELERLPQIGIVLI